MAGVNSNHQIHRLTHLASFSPLLQVFTQKLKLPFNKLPFTSLLTPPLPLSLSSSSSYLCKSVLLSPQNLDIHSQTKMLWGTKRNSKQNREQPGEKQFSFLSCLLVPFLCISKLWSSPKKSNNSNPKPPKSPESKPKIPNPKPNPNAYRPHISFDVMIKSSKNSYIPPKHSDSNLIYGLDPAVHNRRSKGQRSKVANENDLEEFAVAKKSSNPEKDFKESMVRMIRVKQIRRPEELENMLACYLVLNADEYHDVIVKVFRQVWFERSSEPARLNRRPVRANRRG